MYEICYISIPLYNTSTYAFADDDQKAEMLKLAQAAADSVNAAGGETVSDQVSVLHEAAQNALPDIYAVLDGKTSDDSASVQTELLTESDVASAFTQDGAADALRSLSYGEAAAVQINSSTLLLMVRVDPLSVSSLDDLRSQILSDMKGGELDDAEPLWGLLSRGKASSRETYRKELQATVEALRCHPCIGCWVPFNEGWGQFDAAGAVQAIRTLDDTRLVDEASGWYDQGGGDVCSIHNYFYPLHVKPGKRTVALSEYGGIAWPMPGHEAPGKTYGYGTAKSRADLTARCKKLQLGTVLPQLKKGLSALVYTQLTDVEDEVNGLFTYDRAEIKPDANAVRSVNAALAAEFAKVTR